MRNVHTIQNILILLFYWWGFYRFRCRIWNYTYIWSGILCERILKIDGAHNFANSDFLFFSVWRNHLHIQLYNESSKLILWIGSVWSHERTQISVIELFDHFYDKRPVFLSGFLHILVHFFSSSTLPSWSRVILRSSNSFFCPITLELANHFTHV